MKKIISILLLACMLLTVFTACSADENDVGSIIPMRLASAQTDLDPTKMIFDKDFVKFSSLVFEPLTNVTASGKIEKGIASDWYTKYDDERGEYFLYIKLASTRWNDGRSFNAYNVVYAWKNILAPDSASPAASLLYDIKNAKKVKCGLDGLTVDDVCVSAISTNLIEIELEKPIDEKLFLEAISSPALVPVRDDVINKKGWATNIDDIATNGKFTLKSMSPNGAYRIEFSKFFMISNTSKDYNEFVKPYALINDYSKSVSQAAEDYMNNEIYYLGEFTKDIYDENEKNVAKSDTLQSYNYYFNCENKVLSNAKVRKALSTALDREEIASIIGLGTKASTGYVNSIAFGSSLGTSFRKENGALYNTKANVDEAKALLNEAGVKNGSFALTYRSDREYDKAVAEYAKKAWNEIGFNVTLKGLSPEEYKTALYNGEFDVIALDYQGLSTSAYSYLSVFAPEFSGSENSVDVNTTTITPHITKFNNSAYNDLINSILDETTRSARSKKLEEAEKIICDECPAISLVEYSNVYLASKELKGFETSPYGYTDFTDVVLKNYKSKNAIYLANLEEE